MAITIAIFNQAGGVGKTTLVHNLGYLLIEASPKVLLIDLDSQGSLSKFCGLNLDSENPTIGKSLIDKSQLPIISREFNLDIVPANRTLYDAEIQLVSAVARELRLKKLLEPLQDQYDFILIDCPPSLGLLSLLGLAAADWLLCPIQTHPKAFWGCDQLLETLLDIRQINPTLQFVGVIPTLYQKGHTEDRRILRAIKEQLADITTICEPIPMSTVFPQASRNALPLIKFQSSHPALIPLKKLANQILQGSSVISLEVSNG